MIKHLLSSITLLILSTLAFGSDNRSAPNVFSSGSTISSSQMNENFNEIYKLLNDLIYSNKIKCVAVGGSIFSSTDGDLYVERFVNDSGLEGSDYLNNQYFAYGNWDGSYLKSENGINWKIINTDINTKIYGMSFGNGIYISVDANGKIFSSTDSLNWQERFNVGSGIYFSDTLFKNDKFITIGSNGAIVKSSDGINWSTQNSGTTNNLVKIIFAENKFWAIGYSGTILNSDDGTTWTKVTQNLSTSNLKSIVYGNNNLLILDDSNQIIFSTNSQNWTSANISVPVGKYLMDIAYFDNNFYGVGSSSLFVYSDDAVNWHTKTLDLKNSYYINCDH